MNVQAKDTPENRALEKIEQERADQTGVLDLGNLGLNRLPDQLFELTHLKVLLVECFQFGQAYGWQEGKFFRKNISSNPNTLNQLSGAWERLSSLQHLVIAGIPITDLAPIASLNQLQTLHCRYTEITDLAPIASLNQLQILYCSSTPITDLAPIASLNQLQTLDCSSTQITDLAPIASLNQLQTLDCSSTQITDLAPIASLNQLQRLHCSDTQITDLAPIASLNQLQTLDCSSTQITDLAPIASLNQLQRLHCSYTPITDLAPMAPLSLSKIDAFNCPLTNLDTALIENPSLQTLIVGGGHSIGNFPSAVLSQKLFENCLARVRDHLRDLGENPSPINDVKVILLGNGRIGKTQISRRLRGKESDFSLSSTHGIEIRPGIFPIENQDSAELKLWDFGGQDIYHGTHALFLKTQAVFILVWTPDSENQESHDYQGMTFRNQTLSYWLSYIAKLGGQHNPVIVVQNQCDHNTTPRKAPPIDPATQDQMGDRLFQTLGYSAKDDSHREALNHALTRAILDLRSRHRPVMGAPRFAVKATLENWLAEDLKQENAKKRRRQRIPFDNFKELCETHSVSGPETFAEVLHHSGLVFYQRHLFNGDLILDQSWALDAIYTVLNRDYVINKIQLQNGLFNRQDLGDWIWDKKGHSPDEQNALLQMMKSCGIIFVHNDNYNREDTQYVAPDLLPERSTAFDQNSACMGWLYLKAEDETKATFHYPFLSHSLSRTILSKIGSQAGNMAVYWKYGVLFYGPKESAVVVDQYMESATVGRIEITARGPAGGELVGQLIALVEKQNQALNIE